MMIWNIPAIIEYSEDKRHPTDIDPQPCSQCPYSTFDVMIWIELDKDKHDNKAIWDVKHTITME